MKDQNVMYISQIKTRLELRFVFSFNPLTLHNIRNRNGCRSASVPLTSQKAITIHSTRHILGLVLPPSLLTHTATSPCTIWTKKTPCLHLPLLPNLPPPTTIETLLFNKFSVNSIHSILSLQPLKNHRHLLQKMILQRFVQNLRCLRKMLVVVVVKQGQVSH